MKHTFKQRFWKYGKWFGGLFFVMLIFRLMYGYVSTELTFGDDDYSRDFFSSVDNLRKNYASEKKFQKQDVGQQASFASSQKYEKTATVKSKSSHFEKDVKNIKITTGNFEGIIQYEQNTGNKGNQEIHLLIGISPEKFDSFYLKIREFGDIKSKEVTKIDKTNEYRQLNAKKASLEKNLISLNDLKSRGGTINEHIALNNKILEIESQMQELGVELGNFDSENEFCTIKFSLYEGAAERKISFLRRLVVALEWTIEYYAILIFSFLCMALSIFILLLIIDKLKLLKIINTKLNE